MKHQAKQQLRLAQRRATFVPDKGRKRPGSMNRHKTCSIKHLRPKAIAS